ncbi:MAG: SO2930 family diheme c-type cytochrome [Pseudomonadales bacterium]
MPLFSDYAAKYRTLWLPDNERGSVRSDQTLNLPVGSVISKTFFYPQGYAKLSAAEQYSTHRIAIGNARLIETRLLVKQADGWDALTYLWRGNDAKLTRTGAIVSVALEAAKNQHFDYIVPSRNECASCHALNHSDGQLQPIGLKPQQLTARSHDFELSSLERIVNRGWLAPKTQARNAYAIWRSQPVDATNVEDMARDYLDSNCAHCHSTLGPAKNSALNLSRENTGIRGLGVCKPPVAAGKGSGNRSYSIVPGRPDESILSYRLHATDPSRRMPEIGRSLKHTAGTRLVDRWISSLSGHCL